MGFSLPRERARRVSLFFILLSFLGWITFFVSNAQRIDDLHNHGPFVYPFWAAIVLGVVVYSLGAAHVLLMGRRGSIIGGITAFLSVLYISMIGFVMVDSAINFRFNAKYGGDSEGSELGGFFGCVFSSFFWALHLALWPCFYKNLEQHGHRYH